MGNSTCIIPFSIEALRYSIFLNQFSLFVLKKIDTTPTTVCIGEIHFWHEWLQLKNLRKKLNKQKHKTWQFVILVTSTKQVDCSEKVELHTLVKIAIGPLMHLSIVLYTHAPVWLKWFRIFPLGQNEKLYLVGSVLCPDQLRRKWSCPQEVWVGCLQELIQAQLSSVPPKLVQLAYKS